jgi:hypothetical protein
MLSTLANKISTKHSIYLNIILSAAIILLMRGWPVPNGNETLYLILPLKEYSAEFLNNDWLLSKSWKTHFFFNLLFGPFFLFFNMDILAWVFRLIFLLILLYQIFKLGEAYNLQRIYITISILIFISFNQSIVGGEFLFISFEAKTLSYILLFQSFICVFKKKNLIAGVFLGLTFTFHSGVGLFAILAAVPAFLFSSASIKDKIGICLAICIFCLPGFINLFYTVLGLSDISGPDLDFAIKKVPHHIGVSSWPIRNILLCYILLIFNIFHYFKNRKNTFLAFMIKFQIWSCLFFSLGIIAFYFKYSTYIKLFPFRVFPLIVLLFFCFSLFNFLINFSKKGTSFISIIMVVLSLLSFNDSLPGKIIDNLKLSYNIWLKDCIVEDPIKDAFKWIANNTPADSIVLLPPWRRDGWYYTKRAQVACYAHPTYDYRFAEWKKRNEDLIGELSKTRGYKDFEKFYYGLNEKEIIRISNDYNASYLVSRGDYSFDILYQKNGFYVYQLPN